MFNSMQAPLARANRVSSKSPVTNHFLIYFLLLVAGVPLSLFLEVMFNPHARNLEYWSDVNKEAQKQHTTTVRSPEPFNDEKALP